MLTTLAIVKMIEGVVRAHGVTVQHGQEVVFRDKRKWYQLSPRKVVHNTLSFTLPSPHGGTDTCVIDTDTINLRFTIKHRRTMPSGKVMEAETSGALLNLHERMKK